MIHKGNRFVTMHNANNLAEYTIVENGVKGNKTKQAMRLLAGETEKLIHDSLGTLNLFDVINLSILQT